MGTTSLPTWWLNPRNYVPTYMVAQPMELPAYQHGCSIHKTWIFSNTATKNYKFWTVKYLFIYCKIFCNTHIWPQTNVTKFPKYDVQNINLLCKSASYCNNHAVALPDGTTTSKEGDDENNGSNNHQSYRGCRKIHLITHFFQKVVSFVDIGIGQCTSNQYCQAT